MVGAAARPRRGAVIGPPPAAPAGRTRLYLSGPARTPSQGCSRAPRSRRASSRAAPFRVGGQDGLRGWTKGSVALLLAIRALAGEGRGVAARGAGAVPAGARRPLRAARAVGEARGGGGPPRWRRSPRPRRPGPARRVPPAPPWLPPLTARRSGRPRRRGPGPGSFCHHRGGDPRVAPPGPRRHRASAAAAGVGQQQQAAQHGVEDEPGPAMVMIPAKTRAVSR